MITALAKVGRRGSGPSLPLAVGVAHQDINGCLTTVSQIYNWLITRRGFSTNGPNRMKPWPNLATVYLRNDLTLGSLRRPQGVRTESLAVTSFRRVSPRPWLSHLTSAWRLSFLSPAPLS